MLAALVLFLAFAVTVVLLGLQWLGNQGATSAAHATVTTFSSATFTSATDTNEVHLS